MSTPPLPRGSYFVAGKAVVLAPRKTVCANAAGPCTTTDGSGTIQQVCPPLQLRRSARAFAGKRSEVAPRLRVFV